ncbi:MAG: cell division protein SepF [Bacilli bacterium]|nr:cell division protein SepF [Bacilli bacterium]MDD4283221.1 cell division protein SepF [Bacilli bacterium]MDD4400091.1 cell division protein SepF [Dysgonamonadaceae bacterium]
MGFFKKLFEEGKSDSYSNHDIISDEYYKLTADEALEEHGSKMILLEPRAYSEAQQIADYLRERNTVVVNLKRVTPEQAKRIIDFLGGAIYSIQGEIQKIGGGIFLCTPNNINVQGKITDDTEGKGIHDNNDIDVEWQ